jgi:hypothetical protein
VSGTTAGSVSVSRLSGVGKLLSTVGSSTGNGVAGEMVSIPTSKVLHPAARIEILASNKNNNLVELLIFMSKTFKLRIECIRIEFPMIRIYQRDVTEKSLSCHRLVT